LHRAHPLRPFLAELERAGRPDRIDLQPLDRDAFGSFVSSRVGGSVDAALIDWLLARSGGNPFLADALLAAGSGQLSPSLRRVLVARAERLAPTTRHLLDVLAAGGASVPDRLLATLSPLPENARCESLHEAVEHGVIVSTASGASVFRHEVMREAIYDELLPVERARIHEAYAAALDGDPSLPATLDAGALGAEEHLDAARAAPGRRGTSEDTSVLFRPTGPVRRLRGSPSPR
jgi:predicted ATPase